jgi:hypothetical protein
MAMLFGKNAELDRMFKETHQNISIICSSSMFEAEEKRICERMRYRNTTG